MQQKTTTGPKVDIECGLCTRTAVAIDRSGAPLCARHATIFVTVTEPRDPIGAGIMSPKKSSYNDLSDTSDQELVDLYLELAAVFGSKEGPSRDHRIQQAASAAQALEIRGYVEQSGIWIHPEKPHLAATA